MAAEKTGTFRMNISLPNDLKKQMDKSGESVNWSAVAAEAFRTKLLEIEAKKETTTMTDAIKRLKAAAELEDNEMHEAGLAAGKRWASDDATPRQLKRLRDAEEEDTRGDGLISGRPDSYGWPGVLFDVIFGKLERDRVEVESWWQTIDGEESHYDDEDFLRGFVKGAIEFWEEVEDKVKP